MGLVSGGQNGRRYRISTPLPEGFRDLFLEQVRAHAFVPCDTASDAEARIGWVDVFDPANCTFELNTFLYDRYLALSLRADTKKVQGTYLKVATAQRIAEVAAERGVEKLARSEQEAVAEALEAALYARALPSVATTDIAWDILTGEVMVFASSDGPIEQIEALVRDTFGVSMRPEHTADWLVDKLGRDEVVARVAEHLGGKGGEDPLEGLELPLGSDFLMWLWLQSESTDGLFRVIDGGGAGEAALAKVLPEPPLAEAEPGAEADPTDEEPEEEAEWNEVTESLRNADLTLWLDTRLKLRELVEKDPSTTILMGLAPSATPEARQNLQFGKRPVEARLGLQINDLECSLVVEATPEGLKVSGLKIPYAVRDGRDERLFERMVLLDLVHTTVKQLFSQFFLARTSPAWAERIERWLAEDLAAK